LALPFYLEDVDYILHTLSLESPLANIVVSSKMSDINIAAFYIYFSLERRSFFTILISSIS
jgi:hypothetical protein